jgi:hypothetical protein
VLGTPSGTRGYPDLARRAHTVAVGDIELKVVDLADLMRMPRANARPRDRLHLEVLTALRELHDADGPAGT